MYAYYDRVGFMKTTDMLRVMIGLGEQNVKSNDRSDIITLCATSVRRSH